MIISISLMIIYDHVYIMYIPCMIMYDNV